MNFRWWSEDEPLVATKKRRRTPAPLSSPCLTETTPMPATLVRFFRTIDVRARSLAEKRAKVLDTPQGDQTSTSTQSSETLQTLAVSADTQNLTTYRTILEDARLRRRARLQVSKTDAPTINASSESRFACVETHEGDGSSVGSEIRHALTNGDREPGSPSIRPFENRGSDPVARRAEDETSND